MTVFDFKKGEEVTVKYVAVQGGEGARLAALGLKAGVRVQILSFSLFKSAALLAFGGIRLAVRKNIAQLIGVGK